MKLLHLLFLVLALPSLAAAQFTFHRCDSCSPGCPSACPRPEPREPRHVAHTRNPSPPQPSSEEIAKAKEEALYNVYVDEFNEIYERWRDATDTEDEVREWQDFYHKTGWVSALYCAAVAAYGVGNLDEAMNLFNQLTDTYENNPHTACGDSYDPMPVADEFVHDKNQDWSRSTLCTRGSGYIDKIRQTWGDRKLEAQHQEEMLKLQKAREAAARLQWQTDALNKKGNDYRERGQWTDAERVYNKSLALNIEQPVVWTYGLAYVLTKQGRYEGAFESAQMGCIIQFRSGASGCQDTGIVHHTDDAFANMYYWTYANMQQAQAENLVQGRQTLDANRERRAFALLRDSIKFDIVTAKKHPAARALLAAFYRAMGNDAIAEMEADIVLLQYPNDARDTYGAQMILDNIHRKDMEQLRATGHPITHWPNNCATIMTDSASPFDAGRLGCVRRVPTSIPQLPDRILVIPQKGMGAPAEAEGGASEWITTKEGALWREIVRIDGTFCQTKKGNVITTHSCP